MANRHRSTILSVAARACDLLLAPAVALAADLLRAVRRAGIARMPLSRWILRRVGVFPILDHYYEPRFDYRDLRRPLSLERDLPGIDWDEAGQLAALETFDFAGELAALPDEDRGDDAFYYRNGNFGGGDAEYLYSLIRARARRGA